VIAEAVTDGDGVSVKVPEADPGIAVGVITAEAKAELEFAGDTVMALLRQPEEVVSTLDKMIVVSMKLVPL
jgi:hypothetical protein